MITPSLGLVMVEWTFQLGPELVVAATAREDDRSRETPGLNTAT